MSSTPVELRVAVQSNTPCEQPWAIALGSVKFHAPVYLGNEYRKSIPRPPTYSYDVAFDTQKTAYQRWVQISHELQPGETDRFTVKVAVAQSSSHRFRATVRDITGLALQSLPIEMKCFVPRSRRDPIARAISPPSAEWLAETT